MARSTPRALATIVAAVLILSAHPYARQGKPTQPQQPASQQPQPQQGQQQQGQDQQGGSNEQAFRFRTGVELINVTATVTDMNGRFVSGLQKDDFRVYQDDQLQNITHFSNE